MNRGKPSKMIRCAVYTRKSTEEGLDQEFNSLDAQRESCEAYIASQKQEGWVLIQDRYDDGGFSGGNLERPALKKLLEQIEAGLVDCLVTYKIDRLSRSLMDFAKLVEIFDRRSVTFVSVTQSFNTTNSMGRLTLNMLLSFAQYEREITAERIRDKYAASRRKGMWMGGRPPLGYDVQDKRLVINEREADDVRHIFRRFLEVGSTTILSKELATAGIRSKSRTLKNGIFQPGKPMDKGTIYRILNNRTYLGEVSYQGETYPGEHEAIIDRLLWDRVHVILGENRQSRSSRTRAQTPAPLKGIIQCGHCRRAMTPSHTRRKDLIYRYYVCMRASKNSYGECPIGGMAAGDIEKLVIKQVQSLVAAPEMVARVWQTANDSGEAFEERDLVNAMNQLEIIWDDLFPGEKARLMQLLVGRVTVHLDEVEVHLRVAGLSTLTSEIGDSLEKKRKMA
ncbi:MAG: recombinase family protein [Magnetococcales bacterium]|nr:recombinase family protein [Magnetococcales bacterium]